MTAKRLLLSATTTLALAIAALGCATPAFATTITFEDTDGNALVALPDGYEGFSWSFVVGSQTNAIAPINVPSWIGPTAAGWYNGVGCATDTPPGTAGCKGAYAQRNQGGTNTPADMKRASESFIFNHVDWTSTGGTQTLTVEGYSGGALKFRDDHVGLTIHRQKFVFNWAGIDELRIFQADGTDPWVMDNFTYNVPVPVPEPLAVVSLLVGLGVLGALARRRHRG